ncbi:MAG TPA: xanthine dehydrogenase family protein molybdopterin-binding subunit [Kofleriaceae bacterium]|nr:xanthine dehydrogenase family protein molybdopterin-binding subunit [Kofleriaceae bacterium]
MSTFVGQGVPRVDGVAKVTGAARYLDDLDLPGAWHGVTVRSTIAHGTFDGLDLDPGFDWSRVTVVTADRFTWGPGRAGGGLGSNHVALIEDDQPALVPPGGTIRHVAEPLALIAAPTRALALAARAAARPRQTARPPVLTIDDALRAEVKLRGDDNVFKSFLIRKGHADDDELDVAMASAARIVEGTYETGAQEQMYIEPQAMAAWLEAGVVKVVGSMQCPYYVHKAMKALLGCAGDDVVIAQTVTGGGFGGKEEYPSMLAAHCVLLTRAAGVPIKMIYDRAEDIAATTKRHPARVHHRLGLRADGSIAAIDVEVIMDGGAYLTLSPVVLSRGVLHAAGPYRCDVVRIRGRVVATNHPPHGAFRGFGAPQTTFAYERQIDKAARLSGADPWTYRDRHALRLGDTTATGQRLESSVGTDEVVQAIRAAAGEPPERLGVNAHGAPVRRGRGLAFYFHGAGFTGSGEQRLAGRASVAARADGRFDVLASSTDIGQGATTIFTQIAATALGVPVDRVRVADPSTDEVPDSGPTVASRTCMVVGGLVERAARRVRERLAAGEDPAGVVETVQYEPPPGIQWDDATYTGSAYPCYGWAGCLVDVEVDLDTREVTLLRCVHAVDVGKAINPVIVTGQIEGGTVQALGWALLEHIVYKDGRVANANMTNCIVPTFADVPELETIIVECPYPYGPSGAKGVGEIPMDGPAAAVANALEDALGVPFDRIPVLPEDIARALG